MTKKLIYTIILCVGAIAFAPKKFLNERQTLLANASPNPTVNLYLLKWSICALFVKAGRRIKRMEISGFPINCRAKALAPTKIFKNDKETNLYYNFVCRLGTHFYRCRWGRAKKKANGDIGFSDKLSRQCYRPYSPENRQGLLKHLKTGTMNENPVICTSRTEKGACDGVLITLEPKDEPKKVLQDITDSNIMSIDRGGSGNSFELINELKSNTNSKFKIQNSKFKIQRVSGFRALNLLHCFRELV